MRSELGRIWPPPPLAGRGPPPPLAGRVRRRPPPGAGETPRPARGGGRHPHGSDSTSEPTPPKGGSD